MAQSKFIRAVESIASQEASAAEDLAKFFVDNSIDPDEFAQIASTISQGVVSEMLDEAGKANPPDIEVAQVVLAQGVAITFMLGFRTAKALANE